MDHSGRNGVSARAITGAMVLPEDVLIIPVTELSEDHRALIAAEGDQFAITRRYARSPSKIVGPGPASLLGAFRTPTPIVEAIADFALAQGVDPQELLRESYAFLRSCLSARILVPADSPLSSRIVPILVPRDRVDDMEVVRCVKLLDDTEIYQARMSDARIVALKMLRPDCNDWTREALQREAEVLSTLDADVAPTVIARGDFEGRDYLALEWCPGVSPLVVADEIRSSTTPQVDSSLLRLGHSILEAYAALHARGIVHGDPHPGNVVVDHSGAVRILDFGFAAKVGAEPVPRAGLSYYFDPQFAAARRDKRRPPPVTPCAEQYSIAAQLYRVLTGGHTRDFATDAEEALRQICQERLLPFSTRGVRPWPEAEAVLATALAKEPEDRFESTELFLEAWSTIRPRPVAPEKRDEEQHDRLEGVRERVLERLRVGGRLWTEGLGRAPVCSVSGGAAGVAYALYRMALAEESASLLAAADAWLTRAEADMGRADAFYDDEHHTLDKLGRESPYHTESGVHAVRALVSQAAADRVSTERAARRFVSAADRNGVGADLWLGRSGTLLTCANLLGALEAIEADRTEIRELGERLSAELADQIAAYGPVKDCRELPNYGVAHGWAGHLYAAMRWSAVIHRPPAAWIEPRLDELAKCGEPYGRGVRWPWRDKVPRQGTRERYGASWCNGSAGFEFLWALASDVFDREDYLELARRSAWHAWEDGVSAVHLCCGYAGRAYALLDLYARTGEEAWRERATNLTTLAVERLDSLRNGDNERFADAGLYRGEVGIALLIAESAEPEVATMPFFGDEGWRASGSQDRP
jgi:hypothetical protein